jgi:hypothetical protein
MYTRSAIFEGRVHPGREAEFYGLVETELLPIWRRMPGALAVRAFRPLERDEAAPEIFLVQEVDYPSLEAIAVAMASAVRAEGRAATERLMGLCDGKFSHTVYSRLDSQGSN